jgi:hypothetical protein
MNELEHRCKKVFAARGILYRRMPRPGNARFCGGVQAYSVRFPRPDPITVRTLNTDFHRPLNRHIIPECFLR